MTILRIQKKQSNFVVLDKTCLNDSSLSWGAKGLHAYLMAMPDDWSIKVSHLQTKALNGRDAVRAFLSELERAGYIKKSIKRDDETGRFGGMEYLVFESSHVDTTEAAPSPDYPFSVKKEEETPDPDYPFSAFKMVEPTPDIPSPGEPSPGNPPLLNNNRINNNKLNNKTAAEEMKEVLKPSAAVIFSSLDSKASLDGLIQETLTDTQKQKIQNVVQSLNLSDSDHLAKEIEFCILNPKHFSACGVDFFKKLNAIRSVISKGNWQTPVGMIQKKQANSSDLALKGLYAELHHFKKLESSATAPVKESFHAIIAQLKTKIEALKGSDYFQVLA